MGIPFPLDLTAWAELLDLGLQLIGFLLSLKLSTSLHAQKFLTLGIPPVVSSATSLQGGQFLVLVILLSLAELLASRTESFDFGLRVSLTRPCLGRVIE